MLWLYLIVPLVVHALGVGMAAHAVMSGRTAQGTAAWAMALVLVPWIALPFYLVLGDRKFKGYVRAKPTGARPIDQVAARLSQALLPFVDRATPTTDTERALEQLAGWPITRGNQLDLLVDGQATFDAIVAGIEGASSYVVIQFYIFRDDGLGRRVQAALLRARGRGVRVYLLYDEIGSHALPRSYLSALRDAGCECSGFRTKSHKWRVFRVNFRNHRKIVVVDGLVAFVGGHNVGDEYVSLDPVLTPWRDTHVAVRGPAVQCIQLAFAEDWCWANQHLPQLDWSPEASGAGNARVAVVASTPADEVDTASLLFAGLVSAARKRVWMASSYFVPDEPVVAALQLAAMRGADVQLLIPELADSLPPKLSSYTFYEELFPAGVKVLRYMDGFIHEKVALCDELACIGTANLDNRSFRLNFEISVVAHDEQFAGQVERMLLADFGKGRLVEPGEFAAQSLWFRLACRVSRLLAPVQ